MSDQTSRPQDQTLPPGTPPRLRDRVLALRGVLAVALASLVLGGAGGAALGAVSDGADDSGGRPGLGGHGPAFAPNGAPGQGTAGAPVTGSLGGGAG